MQVIRCLEGDRAGPTDDHRVMSKTTEQSRWDRPFRCGAAGGRWRAYFFFDSVAMSPLTLGLDALAFGGACFFDLPLVSFMVRLFPSHTLGLAARHRSWQHCRMGTAAAAIRATRQSLLSHVLSAGGGYSTGRWRFPRSVAARLQVTASTAA